MKHVPNNDKIPFKDMTPEERSILASAWMEDKLEAFKDGYGWQSVLSTDCLSPRVTYRTKPKQLIIPWEHIKPEYKWAAMDKNREVFIFSDEPVKSEDYWWTDSDKVDTTLSSIDVLDIKVDGIDWQHSLAQRPEGV